MRKAGVVTAILMTFAASTQLCGQSSTEAQQVQAPSVYTPTKFDLYTAYCGLWRTDSSYDSTIRLSNQLAISSMDATVTLFMADGTSYPLPVVHLTKSGVKTVSVRAAPATAPPSVAAHASLYGSASVSYRYDWQGTVYATMSILDLSRSLEYDYPFLFPSKSTAAAAGSLPTALQGHAPPAITTIEGPIWKYGDQTGVFLSLANTSAHGIDATLSVLDANGTVLTSQQLSVPPMNTLMPQFASPVNGLGAVRVTYAGTQDDLLLAGGLEDSSHGYSAQIPLSAPPDATVAAADNNFASVGIMVGTQDPMMGFPRGLSFSPYAYFRNNGSQPVQLYTQAMYGGNGHGQAIAVPSVLIAPQQTVQLPVAAAIQQLGLNGELNLVFSYNGQPGSLIAATGSVNQTGTYVFAVEPRGIGQCSSKSAVYWRTDGGFDTMYSVWNPKSEPEDLVFTFQYADAQTYSYPVHLDANGMAMVDVKELMAMGLPDTNGHVLPSSVTEGSLLVEHAAGHKTPMSIVMNGGIYNPQKATCGPITETCNGCTSYFVTPINTVIGASPVQASSGCVWYTGTNDFYNGNWSSGNSGIMAMTSSGMATPAGAGSTQIVSAMSNLPVNMGTFTSGNYIPCQSTSPSPAGGANVQVPTSLSVISAKALAATNTYGAGCSIGLYGFQSDIVYQVLDQNKPPQPIKSTAMEPQEQDLNYVFNGQNEGNMISTWVDIMGGSSQITKGRKYTDAGGTFERCPFWCVREWTLHRNLHPADQHIDRLTEVPGSN